MFLHVPIKLMSIIIRAYEISCCKCIEGKCSLSLSLLQLCVASLLSFQEQLEIVHFLTQLGHLLPRLAQRLVHVLNLTFRVSKLKDIQKVKQHIYRLHRLSIAEVLNCKKCKSANISPDPSIHITHIHTCTSLC